MGRLRRNHKGQSLIESLVCILTLKAFLLGLLLLSYLGLAHSFTDQVLYEGLVCMAERGGEVFCEDRVRKRLTTTFFHLSLETVRLRKDESKFEGRIHWTLRNKKFYYKKKKSLYKKDLLKTPKDLRSFF